jgi:hypothetical protein
MRPGGGGRSGGLGLATELLAGEMRTTTVRIGITARWVGPVPVAGWTASAGLRPGKFPPLFFYCCNSFLLFPVLFFLFDIQICFADLKLRNYCPSISGLYLAPLLVL